MLSPNTDRILLSPSHERVPSGQAHTAGEKFGKGIRKPEESSQPLRDIILPLPLPPAHAFFTISCKGVQIARNPKQSSQYRQKYERGIVIQRAKHLLSHEDHSGFSCAHLPSPLALADPVSACDAPWWAEAFAHRQKPTAKPSCPQYSCSAVAAHTHSTSVSSCMLPPSH